MKNTSIIAVCALIVVLLAPLAGAENKHWQAVTGDWNTDAYWVPYGVPTSADKAYINNGGTLVITSDAQSYDTYVGYDATGTICQTGGTHTVSGDLYIGYCAYSTGSYHLEAGGVTVFGDESVGYAGTGRFTQTGGTHSVSGDFYIGQRFGSTGSYHLDAGEVTVVGGEYVGYSGTGRFTQTGGTHSAGMLQLKYHSGSGGRYVYELEGGILDVGTFTATSGASYNFSFAGGTLSADAVDFPLANTGGVLAPGDGPGVTVIHSLYRQGPTGVFEAQLAGTDPVTQYDWVSIDGPATLEGVIDVLCIDGFVPKPGDTFDVLSAIKGITIGPSGLALTGAPGFEWSLVEADRILRLEYIPEPATLALLGLGGLVVLRRRR